MAVDVTVDWDVGDRPVEISEADAASLLQSALDREGRSGSWEFAIRIVGDAEMRALHQEFMGDASSTDIMTFPYDADDGEQGGDILISVDMAAEHASEYGWSLGDELRFLMLHGLLHILGWNDHDAADRQAMLDRQGALLQSWQGSNRT